MLFWALVQCVAIFVVGTEDLCRCFELCKDLQGRCRLSPKGVGEVNKWPEEWPKEKFRTFVGLKHAFTTGS